MNIFIFAFIRSFRSKLTLFTFLFLPVGLIFITPLWSGEYPTGFTLYSMIILFVGFLLVRSIITDRTTGVIKRIFAAPISTFSYLAQNLLAYQLILLLQIILIILLGMLLYDWTLLLSLQLFLCYTVFGASSIAFTLAWNSFFTNKEISDAVFGAVSSLMGLLGGVYIPLNLLPHFLGRIGMVFPTYWISNALLALFEENHTTYLLSILMLLLFTLAFLIFGSKRRLS